MEDEPLLRLDAVDMMEDAGFTAYEAKDADTALQVLETHTEIGVLFTDIDMPGSMDGLCLARTVRNRFPHIAIVVVSGQKTPMRAEMPKDGGFVPKPYVREAVLTALRDTMEKTES
ncbi:response regulator [Aurantimonas sp. VKM B-3413]|uniref:response regulator n=1 Tax=Aurantimonas sp. VKM B-3413 TaxID=2779401 RepID=UPI00351CF953